MNNEAQIQNEIDTMARTIWGEARGEGLNGMTAVGLVILNRVKKAKKLGGFWWGNDIESVCKKAYQFSCWNQNDPNYKKLLSIDTTDESFATAKRISARLIRIEKQNDITNGANHYHTANISPKWSIGEIPVAVIGNHVFYRL